MLCGTDAPERSLWILSDSPVDAAELAVASGLHDGAKTAAIRTTAQAPKRRVPITESTVQPFLLVPNPYPSSYSFLSFTASPLDFSFRFNISTATENAIAKYV